MTWVYAVELLNNFNNSTAEIATIALINFIFKPKNHYNIIQRNTDKQITHPYDKNISLSFISFSFKNQYTNRVVLDWALLV